MKAVKMAGLNVVAIEDNYAKKDLEKIIEFADIYLKDFRKLVKFIN